MKTKEQVAKDFVKSKGITDNKLIISYENMFKWGYEAGYNAAIEKIKEYLFNTENHPENISEEYLKQTIEFLK